MPKRSNEFQRIVHAMYNSMTPIDGVVTESALLAEHSGVEREIDILAESTVFGVTLRVAVEVRQRSRTDDVQWIDSLVGKFRDLPVNKVIAVSATGFTAAARAKAESLGIQVLSARAAQALDWPAEFHRIGGAMVRRNDRVEVSLLTRPSGRNDFDRDSRVTGEAGADLGSVGDFVDVVADNHRARLSELLRARFLEFYRTLADLRKVLVSESAVDVQSPLWVQTTSGEKIQVIRAEVRAQSAQVLSETRIRHTAIATHLVSSMRIPMRDGTHDELFVTQDLKAPSVFRVQVRPEKTVTRPKTKSPEPGKAKRSRPDQSPGRTGRARSQNRGE